MCFHQNEGGAHGEQRPSCHMVVVLFRPLEGDCLPVVPAKDQQTSNETTLTSALLVKEKLSGSEDSMETFLC